MIFSTAEFLLVFLPASLAVFLAARRAGGPRAALGALTLASLVFYAMWKPEHLPIPIASVVFNWWVGRRIGAVRGVRPGAARRWMLAGVGANVALLAWFKYAAFAVGEVAGAMGGSAPAWLAGGLAGVLPTALPLAISFFTFQQIAYVVDVWRGECAPSTLGEHALLVFFFPHHVAGPITQPRVMLPQLRELGPSWPMAAAGMLILGIGLAKKVVIADPLGRYVDLAFASPESLSTLQAWGALLSYTFQLYFDFSGYSDMAVGLGMLFGVRLPWNFASPYKAASIAEFWRRWHITLSDFLRNYVYIPLGGSRAGRGRTLANVLLVMLLGGVWHGAGWTFALWGLLHGSALAVNHAWRWTGVRVPRAMGWAMTMAVVLAGWVLFRSASVGAAGTLAGRLVGGGGEGDPGLAYPLGRALPYVVVGAVVALLAPNTQALERLLGRRAWAAAVLGAAVWAVAMVHVLGAVDPPAFLYFEF